MGLWSRLKHRYWFDGIGYGQDGTAGNGRRDVTEAAIHSFPLAMLEMLERYTMTVTRTSDPLALLPDHIQIDPTPGTELEDLLASAELLNRDNLAARIACLQGCAEIKTHADSLHVLALQKGLGTRDIEGDWELRALVAELELAALYVGALRLPERARKETGRKGGEAKQNKNATAKEKAKAKRAVFDFWLEREAGRWPNLRTEGQFAIEACQRSLRVLDSPDSVKKWSTAWRKDAKASRKAKASR